VRILGSPHSTLNILSTFSGGPAYSYVMATNSSILPNIESIDHIKKFCFINICAVIVLLPQGWIQEIKRMYLVLFMHGLFLT
jgi:hypothetical protein